MDYSYRESTGLDSELPSRQSKKRASYATWLWLWTDNAYKFCRGIKACPGPKAHKKSFKKPGGNLSSHMHRASQPEFQESPNKCRGDFA